QPLTMKVCLPGDLGCQHHRQPKMAPDQGIRRRRLLPCSPCFALGLLYVSRQALHRRRPPYSTSSLHSSCSSRRVPSGSSTATISSVRPACSTRMDGSTPGRYRNRTRVVTSLCTCCAAQNSRPLISSTAAHTRA